MTPLRHDETHSRQVRLQARSLRYYVREEPVVATPLRWRVWTPDLPQSHTEARGRSPLRALFAAHGAVRRWLAGNPIAAPSESNQQDFRIGHYTDDAFECVTGAQLTGETDPELIVFATLFSNLLDAKRISMVLQQHDYPERWVLFVARHLKHDTLESFNILWRVAQHTSTPTKALEPMAARGQYVSDLDAAILANPNVTRAIVERIARLDHSDADVLGHPLLPADELRRRYAAMDHGDLKRNKRALKAVARHPRCPPDIITELALHPDLFIRAVVACRWDLPPSVRQILAQDESPRVRAWLAGLPWSPPKSAREPVDPIEA